MSSTQIKDSSVRRDPTFDTVNIQNALKYSKSSALVLPSIQAGKSGTAGTLTLYPSTSQKGKIVFSAAASAGDTTTTIVNASQAAARTYTIPDAGASASFVMTAGAQSIAGVKTFTGEPAFPVNALSPLQRFVLFDDFYGTWAIGDAGPADTWSTTEGSGGDGEVATTVANSLCGEITLKTETTATNHATDATLITGIGLPFKANQGGLMLEARLKLDAITNVGLFVGFTDTISTTVEMPLYMASASDTVLSDADNAVGVGFNTGSLTDQFFHAGVKATVDTAAVFSGGAPTAATYFTVRVEVSAAGAVTGYIDGTAIGTAVADAVTITTALTPCIALVNLGAAQRIATVDYIYAQMNR